MHDELCEVRFIGTLPYSPARHDCSQIAISIAEMIVDVGKNPDILRIGKRDMSDKLKPKMYPRMAPWNYHDVCRLDKVVYDPNLGFPCHMDDYMEKLFNCKFRFYYNEALNAKIKKMIQVRELSHNYR